MLSKDAEENSQYRIIYDDLTFEKWPYDKRSILHYKRRSIVLVDKDEPVWGPWRYRLGDNYGPWYSAGSPTGQMTKQDVHKINFRFCGALDFCEYQPNVCEQIEEEEVKLGCKQLYLDIASGKVNPSNSSFG